MAFQKEASRVQWNGPGFIVPQNRQLDSGKMKNLPYQLPQPFLRNTRPVLLDVFEFVKPTGDFDLQVGHKELLTR